MDNYEIDEEFLENLQYADDETLKAYGLKPWDEEQNVWLFPEEWYNNIPEGFEVITITDRVIEFDRSEESSDGRFGALAFGISRPDYEPGTTLEDWRKKD